MFCNIITGDQIQLYCHKSIHSTVLVQPTISNFDSAFLLDHLSVILTDFDSPYLTGEQAIA